MEFTTSGFSSYGTLTSLDYAVVFLYSYLLGSIPFGLLFTKYAGLGDIRNIGSGNVGATNVLRTGKKTLALFTLLADALKGAAAVYITIYLYGMRLPCPMGCTDNAISVAMALSGFAALFGHMHPIWLNFKGGKGVATYLGVLATIINFKVFLAAILTWLLVFLITRISSLSAIIMLLVTPPLFYLYDQLQLFSFFVGTSYSIWIIYAHRENIKRLIKGEESSFRKKKE